MKLFHLPVLNKFTRLFLLFFIIFEINGCEMHKSENNNFVSRNLLLPLFNPHMKDFECKFEATMIPLVDAQADEWFYESLTLDSADIYLANRQYKKIVQLTRQAAERRHWKALLNLASLYLAGRDQEHGVEDAVRLVEEAMRLGVPAAFDRMGTYYMNGTGVEIDPTRAYAFWQRAAEMGSPAAMAYIGEKIDAVWDDPDGTFWANKKVGLKMLICSFAQGDGDAAYRLAKFYINQFANSGKRDDLASALKFVHEGVKFGSELCANQLSIEFSDPIVPTNMIAPYIDQERARRYGVLGDALGFDPSDRFPNLDKVLPLPPARLPPWNGDRDTLLRTARGVTAPAAVPEPTAASQRSGRYFLEAGFALRDTGQETQATTVPMEGYWQPLPRSVKPEEQAQLKEVMPGLYRRGEAFASFMSQHGHGALRGIIWHRWDTVRLPLDAVAPLAPVGMTKSIPRPLPLQTCSSGMACPVTGTWQPWVRSDHPLHLAINQYWRQAWLVKGQVPPDPQRDWHLPIDAAEVTWHLMDSSPVNLLNDKK